ncbi:Hypothetical protein PHPALM_73 [Phytophthora palmivora]|uniref:Uncharacterized protein n=1 Tax=Phytophthora palmivora TaxID=4796 RepID=A0A2P4YVQ6_9STRA|nr:Hypothetical protein PHPALM_73 [Phytophthora palmivora]
MELSQTLKTLLNEHRKLVKLPEITHKVKVENYHINLVVQLRLLSKIEVVFETGQLSKEAKKIYKLPRVSEMWTSSEQSKTKRDFANSIRIRAKPYGARFEKGRNLDRYLEELEDYRRQLENMNTAISDNEMANITLTGVEGILRNLVRIFHRDDNPPTLNQVLNSLRGEAETDKAEKERISK